jgi:SAM-dependent methyltransferase
MRVENGVIVGSNGKYDTLNPIARHLLNGFDQAIKDCINNSTPKSILEIGCGDGHVTELILQSCVSHVLATDISVSLIEENRLRFVDKRVTFAVADLMTIDLLSDEHWDVLVCCEVIEHLEAPVAGLHALYSIGAREYIFSVPREPIWRIMNMCRGSYLSDFGNSPGHINHFSQTSFLRFIEKYFTIIELKSPLPWTIVRCKPR